eukprot:TRINITY_DN890_c0_g1_i4.p1 TRINITY_DN890_c0_g1~~TRINITY_DN890_c0_g1_i4.p1  ORF type:complete len:1195 (+),score=229.62 TRINITY_DN890_c0_g1_i4:68-3586(+)
MVKVWSDEAARIVRDNVSGGLPAVRAALNEAGFSFSDKQIAGKFRDFKGATEVHSKWDDESSKIVRDNVSGGLPAVRAALNEAGFSFSEMQIMNKIRNLKGATEVRSKWDDESSKIVRDNASGGLPAARAALNEAGFSFSDRQIVNKIQNFKGATEVRSKWDDESRKIVRDNVSGTRSGTKKADHSQSTETGANPEGSPLKQAAEQDPFAEGLAHDTGGQGLMLPECMESEWDSETDDGRCSCSGSDEEYLPKLVDLAVGFNKMLADADVDPSERLADEGYEESLVRRCPELLLPLKDLPRIQALKRGRDDSSTADEDSLSLCSTSDDETPPGRYADMLAATQKAAATWEAHHAAIPNGYALQGSLIEQFWMHMPGSPCGMDALAHHSVYGWEVPAVATNATCRYVSLLRAQRCLQAAGVQSVDFAATWDSRVLGRLGMVLNTLQVEVLRAYLLRTGVAKWCAAPSEVPRLLGLDKAFPGMAMVTGVGLSFTPVDCDAQNWNRWLHEVRRRGMLQAAELEAAFNYALRSAAVWGQERWEGSFSAQGAHVWVLYDTLRCRGADRGVTAYEHAKAMALRTDDAYAERAAVWEILACRTANATRMMPHSTNGGLGCESYAAAMRIYNALQAHREKLAGGDADLLSNALLACLHDDRCLELAADSLHGVWTYHDTRCLTCATCGDGQQYLGKAHGMAREEGITCPRCSAVLRPETKKIAFTSCEAGVLVECESLPPFTGFMRAELVCGPTCVWEGEGTIVTREHITYKLRVGGDSRNTVVLEYAVTGFKGAFRFHLLRESTLPAEGSGGSCVERQPDGHWTCFPVAAKIARFRVLDDYELLSGGTLWSPWPMINPPVPPRECLAGVCRVDSYLGEIPEPDEVELSKVYLWDDARAGRVRRYEIASDVSRDRFYKLIAHDRLRRMVWITGEVGGGRTLDVPSQRTRHPFCTCSRETVVGWSNPTKPGEDPCMVAERGLQTLLYGEVQTARSMAEITAVAHHAWRDEWIQSDPSALKGFPKKHCAHSLYESAARFFGGLNTTNAAAVLTLAACVASISTGHQPMPSTPAASTLTSYYYGDTTEYLTISDKVTYTATGLTRTLLRKLHQGRPGQSITPNITSLCTRAQQLNLVTDMPRPGVLYTVVGVPGVQPGTIASVNVDGMLYDVWPGDCEVCISQ